MILAIAPIVAWLIRVASRKLRGSNQEMQQTTGQLTGMVEETLNGVREIKLVRHPRPRRPAITASSAATRTL